MKIAVMTVAMGMLLFMLLPMMVVLMILARVQLWGNPRSYYTLALHPEMPQPLSLSNTS